MISTAELLKEKINEALRVRGITCVAEIVPTAEPELYSDGLQIGLPNRRPGVELKIAGGKVQVYRLTNLGGEIERKEWGRPLESWRAALIALHVIAALAGVTPEIAISASPSLLTASARAGALLGDKVRS